MFALGKRMEIMLCAVALGGALLHSPAQAQEQGGVRKVSASVPSHALARRPSESGANTGASLSAAVEHACLALALYHEARGEPVEGQVAVAMTVLNRVASKTFPDSICGVVFQNMRWRNACQFTFACNGRSLTPKNVKAFRRMTALSGLILKRALNPDAYAGDYFLMTMRKYAHATHYHRHDVHPRWSRKMVRLNRVGDHVFFASRRVLNRLPERKPIVPVRATRGPADAGELKL